MFLPLVINSTLSVNGIKLFVKSVAPPTISLPSRPWQIPHFISYKAETSGEALPLSNPEGGVELSEEPQEPRAIIAKAKGNRMYFILKPASIGKAFHEWPRDSRKN